MAKSHREDEWGRLSSLMALVASAASGKKRNPSEFNPYTVRKSKPGIKVNLADLRGVFMSMPTAKSPAGLIGGGNVPVSAGSFVRGQQS